MKERNTSLFINVLPAGVNRNAFNREYDCKYLAEDKNGKKYIFKIANDEHGYEFFDAQVKIVKHLSATGSANNFCRHIKKIVGKELMVLELDSKRYCLRLLTFLDGEF